MQRFRIVGFSVLRVATHETSRGCVVVSGAEVVQVEVGIVLFAASERVNAKVQTLIIRRS